jgi:glutaredoxin
MKIIIRSFFKTVRFILGPIILFLDYVTTPKGIQRSTAEQAVVDEKTRKLVLYQFRTCPFCIKTRRAIKRLSLNIEMRDAQHDMQSREELLNGGGKIKVPCLKITSEAGEVQWLYESDEIIAYLEQEFA